MKTTSKQIETELNNATKRLDELTEMRDGITNNLQTLQAGFIDGETLLDELQSEQGKLTTLESSIKALEAKQDELHTAFQKVSASETRQALLEEAKVTATEAEKFHHEFISIRNEFGDKIRDYAEKTVDKIKAWRNKQMDFKRIEKEIELTFQELGVQSQTYRAATAQYINPPPVEYDEAVTAAINFLIAKLDRAAQDKSRARFNEERLAKQEKIKAQIEAENKKPKPLVVTYDQQ